MSRILRPSPRQRPERCPDRMVRVNGRGYQRACSYRHHAAVAEMSVTSGSFRPGRADVVLSVPALISRTAGYAIRMSGAVGGALSDGRPYPYIPLLCIQHQFHWQSAQNDCVAHECKNGKS